jgi:P27 family predicted phage terminase small subunit
MPGPPPEHRHLRLLKGNLGKRPARSPPGPARADKCPEPPPQLNAYAKEVWFELAPELFRLNLLTVLDVGPFAAYCAAAARLRLAEESLEQMGKQDPRGHALTIKGSAGSQVTNPLLRIASQAMNDSAQFGLTPTGQLRFSGMEPPPGPNKFEGVLES